MFTGYQERRLMAFQASTSGSVLSCAPGYRTRHRVWNKASVLHAPKIGIHANSAMRGGANAQSGEQMMTYPEVEYSPIANDEYWDVRPIKVMRRALQIGRAFSGWYLSSKIFGEQGIGRVSGHQAERLREILTQLGPAFVKIGQALSSRPDIAPPGFIKELEKLQDNIPPFQDAQAMRIIQEDMGQPVTAIFSEISASSVAAASLGQVYKAKIKNSDKWVAVKVQRPGVRESIALDVYIMRFFAGQIGRFRKLNSDLPSLLDEWAGSLFRELDYRREAENGTLFKQLYSHLEGIYVPEMMHELTTGRVLTIEWLDGVRLRSAGQKPGDGQTLQADEMKLIEFGVHCSLEQMLEEGFYHADPHPGNLLRLRNGKLGYLDFGMMASIGPNIRRSLITATLHMVNREFDSLASDFESLGLLPAGSEKEKVVPALARVFESALSGGVSNMSFGTLSGDLGKTMYEFKFRIPAYYILLVRSLSVLEGIALSSDPNYKVLGAAYPWIARRLLSSPNPELQDTLRALLYKEDKFQFHRLESLLRQALRSPARRSRDAATPVTPSAFGDKPMELLLGEDGSFVRGVILDEIAKGIDAALRLSADTVLGRAKSRLATLFRSSGRTPALESPTSTVAEGGSASLLTALGQLPSLSDKSDQAQVQGIQSLVQVLQDVRLGTSQGKTVFNPQRDVGEAITILNWFLQELGTLSPAARAEALMIPISIGGRLSSRLLARAIKAFANREANTPRSLLSLRRRKGVATIEVPSLPPTMPTPGNQVLAQQSTLPGEDRTGAEIPSRQTAAENVPEVQRSTTGPAQTHAGLRQNGNDVEAIDVELLRSSQSRGVLQESGTGKTTSAEPTHTETRTGHQDARSEEIDGAEKPELTASDANTWDWRVKRLYQQQQASKRSKQLLAQSH